MKGLDHLIIAFFAILGTLIGSIGYDFDHGCNLKGYWRGFWTENPTPNPTEDCKGRGFFHKPVVMLSIAAFSLFLGIATLFHYIMDYVKVVN